MVLKNKEEAKELIFDEFGGDFSRIKNNKEKLNELKCLITNPEFLIELSRKCVDVYLRDSLDWINYGHNLDYVDEILKKSYKGDFFNLIQTAQNNRQLELLDNARDELEEEILQLISELEKKGD